MQARPAHILIFDRYMPPSKDGGEGAHIIDIYVPRVRYIVRGNEVIEVTRDRTRIVPRAYAQRQVDLWREREAKIVTALPPTRRQMWYILIGFVTLAASMVGALWWLLG